jgi:uncharacterized ferritin-like protein (DUF455 family)
MARRGVSLKENASESSSNWFSIAPVRDKIACLPLAVEFALGKLTSGTGADLTLELGRDARVVAPAQLPPKPGLSTQEGQARLLHDLASIELQAMALATRTLFEFPDAPSEFRKELSEIAFDESRHLTLCLDGIEKLGYRWGHWDVHLMLWNAVSSEDSLLTRILIVHRYLEGSGLDAGESILRRLSGVVDKTLKHAISVIVNEEVGHVRFGSRWYKKIAEELKIDPEKDFAERIGKIALLAPRRERIARELRKLCGFTDFELEQLERIEYATHPK